MTFLLENSCDKGKYHFFAEPYYLGATWSKYKPTIPQRTKSNVSIIIPFIKEKF